ncbi:hypothetical protein FOVG_18582 [Fusarium oxysporum f. sp. pisi HDV247]|uniref:Uncharacterized protein n=1 Tax=Fusarium oxysporum f. sp. pisi HDV247 TaxID=1080344 RepID=W9NQ82_FUSOX|nr:hypothetical protein FOVG_18582 [Fusarium oxysporum f. sp. pisi HDV247]
MWSLTCTISLKYGEVLDSRLFLAIQHVGSDYFKQDKYYLPCLPSKLAFIQNHGLKIEHLTAQTEEKSDLVGLQSTEIHTSQVATTLSSGYTEHGR